MDKKAAEKLDMNGNSSDNRKTLDAVFSNFSNVDCFLMPHPGLIVHTSDSFKPKGLRFLLNLLLHLQFYVTLSDIVNQMLLSSIV